MSFKKYHIYLGVILLAPLLVIVISGMVLGFQDVIRYSRFPYQLNAPIASEQALQGHSADKNQNVFSPRFLGQIDGLIKRKYPDLKLDAVHLPIKPGLSARAKLTSSEPEKTRLVFIDPYESKIIAEQIGDHPDLMDWILKIHRGTWAGFGGKVFASCIGLLTFSLWPTGCVMRKARINLRKSKRVVTRKRNSYDYHRLLGFFFGAVFSCMALSGSLINFNNDLMKWVDPAPNTERSKNDVYSVALSAQNSSLALDLPTFFQIAQSARPSSRVRSIYFPKVGQANILFYFTDNSRVYLNYETRKIEKVMSTSSNWLHSLYPLHSGRIFGGMSIVLTLSIGVLTLLLLWTGIRSAILSNYLPGLKE